jgi:hypothetical protein
MDILVENGFFGGGYVQEKGCELNAKAFLSKISSQNLFPQHVIGNVRKEDYGIEAYKSKKFPQQEIMISKANSLFILSRETVTYDQKLNKWYGVNY